MQPRPNPVDDSTRPLPSLPWRKLVLAFMAGGLFLLSTSTPPLAAQPKRGEVIQKRTSDTSPRRGTRSGSVSRGDKTPARPPAGGSGGSGKSDGGSHGHDSGYRPTHSYGHGYGYGYYRPYYPYFPGHPYYYGGYGVGVGFGYASYDSGALDLDVKPKKTEVYIDGNYIGVVDKYDGFPRYLWLRKGTYEISFYLDGYETVTRVVTVYPGLVIDIKDRMTPGEGLRPEPRESPQPEYGTEDERGEDARDSYSDPGMRRRDVSPSQRQERSYRPGDFRSEPARLALQVHPADASVYLDGRFLGSGAELARLHSSLVIDPGEHVLQVLRPGYRDQELRFEARPGEEVELDVELDR